MTERTAEQVANVVLTAALVGGAVIVIRTPALRRLAFGLAATALTQSLPRWFAREVRRAWNESAPPGARPTGRRDSGASAASAASTAI